MQLTYMASVDSLCIASVEVQSCTIRTALVVYTISILNNDVQVDRLHAPRVIKNIASVGDSIGAQRGLPAGALTGLYVMAIDYLRSNQTMIYNTTDGAQYIASSYGATALKYLDYDTSNYEVPEVACSWQWQNATSEILADMHEVMFRMGFDNGIHLFSNNSIAPTLVYYSEFSVFWIAGALMIAAFFCSSSLFWGYWRLNRQVTLSPLETARALSVMQSATLLNQPDMELETLLGLIGDVKVTWCPREADGEEGEASSVLESQRE